MQYIFLLPQRLGIVQITEQNTVRLDELELFDFTEDNYVSMLQGQSVDNLDDFLSNTQIKDAVCTERPIYDYFQKKKIDIKLAELEEYKTIRRKIRTTLYGPNEIEKIQIEDRDVAFSLAQTTLRSDEHASDVYIAQSILAVDDLNNSINLIVARLKEFYGLHFPELDSIVRDNHQYLRLVADLGYRSEFDEESLANISEERRKKILHALESTLGGELDPNDYQPIKELAELGLGIEEKKNQLEEYIEETLATECPNMVALIGSLLTARLLAEVGSLKNLARSPSSTIQVLGAEKALFRHLRKGADPPKHGIIFQSKYIHQAPKWQRGKIARVLAGKIAMAARIDYFTKKDRSERLLDDLNERLKEIRSSKH